MSLDAVEATISDVQVTTVFTVAKVAVGTVIIPRLPPVIRYKGIFFFFFLFFWYKGIIYVHFSSIGILAWQEEKRPARFPVQY
jgi:hypothetical protein